MASPLSILIQALGERLDEDLLPAVYAAVSVPTAEIRAWMQASGIAHVDPEAGGRGGALPQGSGELEESANRVIAHARDRATALGIAGGFVGAVAIPPEILASMVSTLRLAQRLAVLHGFDPETEAGRIVMWRALAAAYEVKLPTQGPVGLRVRELPDVLRSQVPATRQASAWLARQVVLRTTASVVGRFTRLVPGLGAGLAGFSAHRRTNAMGAKMVAVYARAMTAAPFDLEGEDLAIEVG